MSTHESPESASLPVAQVQRWLAPVTRFLHVEASSGIVLFACMAMALAIGTRHRPRQDGPSLPRARPSRPLQRLEDGLHLWVAFVIMPLFALANAGVILKPSSLGEPVAIAVATALAMGKPLGILFACVLAVRLRVTSLPDGVTWGLLGGGACLAGIGFTMAFRLEAATRHESTHVISLHLACSSARARLSGRTGRPATPRDDHSCPRGGFRVGPVR